MYGYRFVIKRGNHLPIWYAERHDFRGSPRDATPFTTWREAMESIQTELSFIREIFNA